MTQIVMNQINKYYGKNHVLKDLNLTIESGAFMTLLGPSGCGKTTTLRVLAGLERPQSGSLFINGKKIVHAEEAFFLPPSKRNLNLVFQSYALWPHMTVWENVAFGLKTQKLPSDQVKHQVEDALKRMQIDAYANRYPSELSGGQQQRVAIARAIASSPTLLLLDEPLSNLDAKLRMDMRSELKRLHTETGTTMVYVTHDQVEALTLSTQVAIFKEGVIIQAAPPLELYNNPASLYVADFIGNPRINLIPGTATRTASGIEVQCALDHFFFPNDDLATNAAILQRQESFPVVLGIRPEQIELHAIAKPKLLPAQVHTAMPAGSETLLTVRVQDESLLIKTLGNIPYAPDQTVFLSIDPKKINVFDQESEMLIKYAI